MLEHDYNDISELAEIRKSIAPQLQLADTYLSSNGSTGSVRLFTFGPNSRFWLTTIEDHIKYRPQSKFVGLHPSILVSTAEFNFTKHACAPENTIPTQYVVAIQLHRSGAINYLIEQLQRIRNSTIFSTPVNWLYLLSEPNFRNFLESSSASGMSTNWEGFYRNPPANFHLNDNMVNWTTGMNFYTCPYGTRHYLPTFVVTVDGIVNLLNLAGPAILPVDDAMDISPNTCECQCGRTYRPFTFIPHINQCIRSATGEPIYDLQLANQLKSKYLNLQFIQEDQTIHVLYITTDHPQDMPFLTEYFDKHGLRVEFIPNKYYILNSKLPVFWRTDHHSYCEWDQNDK